MNHSWVHSNKTNFGDGVTTIISLLPRLEVYNSIKALALSPGLVYFNNLGMGIGIGNHQPINKSNNRRYLPGTVSLTIESNLEFAVFRHVPGARNLSENFFNTSKNAFLSSQDLKMGSLSQIWKSEVSDQQKNLVNRKNNGNRKKNRHWVGKV